MIGRRILALRHAGLAGMVIVAAWAGLAGAARADMSVDGTRFVYPAREKAISVYVGNIGAEPILVQSWLDRGEARDANDLARLKVPFVLTPPLLRLEPNERKAVQLRYTGESCPGSRVPVLGEFPGSAGRKRRAEQPAPATEPVDEGLVPARGPARKGKRCAGQAALDLARCRQRFDACVGGKPTPYSVTFRTLKCAAARGWPGWADRSAPVVRVLRGTLAPPRDQGGLSLDYESVDDFGAAARQRPGRVRARRLSAIGWPRGRPGIARRRNHVPPSVSSPDPRATRGAASLLVELLLAGGVALPAVDAWAQNVPARATTCRIASFGDGQTSGAPGFLRRSATWAAARSSRTAPYWPSGRSRCRPSARWCRQPRRTGTTWRPERRGPGLGRTAAPSFPRMCGDRDPATSGARGQCHRGAGRN